MKNDSGGFQLHVQAIKRYKEMQFNLYSNNHFYVNVELSLAHALSLSDNIDVFHIERPIVKLRR